MDKSEIKSLLKEARNLLQKGNDGCNGTLVITKKILKQDSKHYQALVLEGAALQQVGKANQSLESYKKAIAVDPKQILAWQGVAAHYEKRGIKEHEELLVAYKEISNILAAGEDKSKYLDATTKYVGQLQSQGLFPQCVKVLARVIKSHGNSTKLSTMAVSILAQMGNIGPNEEFLYLLCLGFLHGMGSATDEEYRKYFQILFKQENYTTLEKVCCDLKPRFNSFYYPLDYLCRLYVENNLSSESSNDVPLFVEKLFKLYPSSSFGHFAQGKVLFEQSHYVDAITWLKQGVESKLHEDAVYVLLLCLEKIWDFDGVEEYCLKILKNENIREPQRFIIFNCHSYIHQKKYKEAAAAIDKLPPDRDVDILKALIAAGEGRKEEFEILRQTIVPEDWRVELCQALLQTENQSDHLINLTQKYPENFDLLLSCGIELLKLSNFADTFDIFQKCVPIYRNHPVLLCYIGQLFVEENELDGALKYLTEAYKALPSSEIGMYLSDLYFKTKNIEANKELLKLATKKLKRSKSKWAWLRLGMLHLELNEPSEATVALQSAIRSDHSDCNVWETLADAYYARGSYEASQKAFEACVKLGAEPTYPKLKIGVIQRHLGENEESIATLSELHDYTPALVELSKTWLQVSSKRLKEGLGISVVKAVSECIKAAVKVLNSHEQILGLTIITASIIVASDLNPNSIFKVPTTLLRETGKIDEFVDVDLKELLGIGLKTSLAVSKNSDSKHLISFQHSEMSKIYHKLAVNMSLDTLDKAIYHAKKAVSLNPSISSYWNSLGLVAEAAGQKATSQNAYLKSIQISPANAKAWTNLGFLYHSNGKSFKAHFCFNEAQRFEPSFGPCWIGQGLVAEALAKDKEEATDLYRHAAVLDDTNIRANLCYAYWICKTLLSPNDKNSHHFNYTIDHLDAIHVSLEKISLYNARHATSASLTIQGMLQAEVGLFESSLKTFEMATIMSKTDTERRSLEVNQIVVLRTLERYDEVLQRVDKLKPEFKTLANKALALEKVGKFEKAYETYGKLLISCSTDVEKSNVLISQGLVSYRLHGLDMAKTLLFRGCELAGNPEGYIALCSLALVDSDLYLANSIVAKMIERFHKQKFIHNIALMKSFCLVASDGEQSAPLHSILSFIHKYPRSGKLWKVLANHFINFHTEGQMARRGLMSASILGEETTLPAVALTYLLEGNYEKALKEAQCAVLENPIDLASLSIMVAALSARYSALGSENDHAHSIKLAQTALTSPLVSKSKNLYYENLRQWLTTYVSQFS